MRVRLIAGLALPLATPALGDLTDAQPSWWAFDVSTKECRRDRNPSRIVQDAQRTGTRFEVQAEPRADGNMYEIRIIFPDQSREITVWRFESDCRRASNIAR